MTALKFQLLLIASIITVFSQDLIAHNEIDGIEIVDVNSINIYWKNYSNEEKQLQKFLDGELSVDAWKKISDGGIDDFINQPGYIETLQRVAKYQDEALSGATGNVKYYRVQTEHPLSKALSVENNNLVFHKLDNNLNISTTSRTHADYYAAKKTAQGNTVEIIEFEVPKSVDIQMKQAAIPQYNAPKNLLNSDGNASNIVDPLQPGDPFELSPHWHQLIEQNYIQGSAKIVN